MSDTRKPVPPNPPRWQPSQDPASIHIPGLDTTASVNDQVDQIEHMITFKLQNIDENFSKIQHLLATKLLPAVQRYAVGTEPVREAAKFWTSFYEQAAQIRIPTYDEYESNQTQSDTTPTDPPPPTQQHTYVDQPSIASAAESSFGNAAFSSTPAPNSRHRSVKRKAHDPAASWSASAESPLVLLDREIKDFTRKDKLHLPEPSFAPPPSLNKTRVYSRRTPRREDIDDSFDGLPPGMSPPRMMSPAAPPRSSAELGLLKLGKTPIKDAAERIRLDLINEQSRTRSVTRLFGRGGLVHGTGYGNGTESSMSTVPTPPSLSIFSSAPSDSIPSMVPTYAGAPQDASLITPLPLDDDLDSDSDSMDEINDTGHPSAAFLLASQAQRPLSDDDSFDSSIQSNDSFDGGDFGGMAPIHPFAHVGDGQQYDFEDDSFGNEGYTRDEGPEEETLFGLPPHARIQRDQELRLLGQNLLDDTTGMGARISMAGQDVVETPTPWSRNER